MIFINNKHHIKFSSLLVLINSLAWITVCLAAPPAHIHIPKLPLPLPHPSEDGPQAYRQTNHGNRQTNHGNTRLEHRSKPFLHDMDMKIMMEHRQPQRKERKIYMFVDNPEKKIQFEKKLLEKSPKERKEILHKRKFEEKQFIKNKRFWTVKKHGVQYYLFTALPKPPSHSSRSSSPSPTTEDVAPVLSALETFSETEVFPPFGQGVLGISLTASSSEASSSSSSLSSLGSATTATSGHNGLETISEKAEHMESVVLPFVAGRAERRKPVIKEKEVEVVGGVNKKGDCFFDCFTAKTK